MFVKGKNIITKRENQLKKVRNHSPASKGSTDVQMNLVSTDAK